MRTNKNTSKIILATIVAFLATVISYSAFSNMRGQMNEQQKLIEVMQNTAKSGQVADSFAYAVSTADLKAGEIVSEADVDFKQFEIENKDAIQNRSEIVNKILLKDIVSGDTFTTAHIAQISGDNVDLRDGYRALTLPADSFQGKTDKIKPGSVVDIYSTTVDSNWILENVKIMSFESGGNPPNSPVPSIMNASAITFEVSASDISSFISNISKGKLMFVTRNERDRKSLAKKTKHSNSNYSASAYPSLPNLPKSVPITDLGGAGGLSGLPQPIQPVVQQPAVEVIEANVKSKVTFD